MKFIFLKRFLIIFSILATTSYGIVRACADFDSQWFGFSDFTPEPFVDKTYVPLLFSPMEVFYGINFNDTHAIRFNDEVVSDWSKFLTGKMTEKDVKFFLLDDKSKSVVNSLYASLFQKKNDKIATDWNKKIKTTDTSRYSYRLSDSGLTNTKLNLENDKLFYEKIKNTLLEFGNRKFYDASIEIPLTRFLASLYADKVINSDERRGFLQNEIEENYTTIFNIYSNPKIKTFIKTAHFTGNYFLLDFLLKKLNRI